jgi:hypothetical protein
LRSEALSFHPPTLQPTMFCGARDNVDERDE